MKTFEFKIVLAGLPELTDDQSDRLFQAGCGDGTIVSRDGTTFVRFSRESSSLEEAIRSAAADVQTAGFGVDHIEVPCPA